ncbi:MAG: SGNH/GDSL hydrolase family protein [Chloroflexi bacterium]|nr:MAG: SGNH/GDSL hydrolase family protein [Chloroflexota bacterium]MBL1193129.1 SGNH/GDSL hydrolase family protein [Chloroflexota bacterium]NOH10422.1 SGNH/GDSL hydrolase family protein [Chloroflexota bacterium]
MTEKNDLHPQKPLRVFFFGDSICFGQGISIHKGWVTRISASLSELGLQYQRNIVVINASHSGNTTRQALERMPYDIQSQSPDALIIQFGMNDCNYWETDKGNPRVSPNAFAANLQEIIVRSLNFGTKAVFLHTNHPTGRDQEQLHHATLTYQESNKQYNKLIREVARNQPENVYLNDIEAAFFAHIKGGRRNLADLLLPDQLHPSEKGHSLYFETVFPIIKERLELMIQNDAI